ncbi:hypothetical protein [Mesobacillus harenae]|uniref:hypothetical protein n=1 Tax=Mesobacillus harenae TaxID=2213203 RepID=UPI001580D2DE|nr:hypothetical protein [Mesobacillus harenae]
MSKKHTSRKWKNLFIKTTAGVTATLLLLAPISASAQTSLTSKLEGTVTKVVNDITSQTKTTTEQTSTTSSKSLTGTLTNTIEDPSSLTTTVTETLKDPVTVVTDTVKDVVEETTTVTDKLTESLKDPTGTIDRLKPEETDNTGKLPSGTDGVKDPTGVTDKITDTFKDPTGITDKVTDTLKNPTGTIGKVTDLLQDPASLPDKVTDLLPGQGSSEEPAEQTPGLIGVGLLEEDSLSAKLLTDEDKYKIELAYSGKKAVSLTLLGKTYIHFNMPQEFAELLADPGFKDSLTASYSVPIIGLPGSPAFNNGSFESADIHIDTQTNSVYLAYSDMLSVALATPSTFKLEINLDELPVADDLEYTFYSIAHDKNAISIDLIESEGASATIALPEEADPGSDNDEPGDGSTPGGDDGDDGDSGDGKDNSDGTTAPGSNNGSSPGSGGGGLIGGLLPNTASDIWNFAFAGLIILMLGAAAKLYGRKFAG